jgi:hypothetical protein
MAACGADSDDGTDDDTDSEVVFPDFLMGYNVYWRNEFYDRITFSYAGYKGDGYSKITIYCNSASQSYEYKLKESIYVAEADRYTFTFEEFTAEEKFDNAEPQETVVVQNKEVIMVNFNCIRPEGRSGEGMWQHS